MRCCCEVQTSGHLGAGHYEGPVKHHPGEEARVPEHGSEGDHAAHAVAHQEEGQLPVLVLGINNAESISCGQACKCCLTMVASCQLLQTYRESI